MAKIDLNPDRSNGSAISSSGSEDAFSGSGDLNPDTSNGSSISSDSLFVSTIPSKLEVSKGSSSSSSGASRASIERRKNRLF